MRNPIQKPFPYRNNNALTYIVAINVLAFIIILVTKSVHGLALMTNQQFAPWQFFTYMYLHANIWHVGFNMLILFFIGIQVERQIGSYEFLLFYHVVGVLSGVLTFGLYVLGGEAAAIIGASGALYGVMFLFAVLNPRAVIYIWGILPVPAPLLVLGLTLLNIVNHLRGGSNVAHMAHLFGFAAAYLYCLVRLGINPIKELFIDNR